MLCMDVIAWAAHRRQSERWPVSNRSSASSCSARSSRSARVGGWLPFIALLAAASLLRADSALAANQVSYLGSPPPAVSGVLLPASPTTLDSVFHRASLANTFQNGCFAQASNGDITISVNEAQRTIVVDFDESTATLFPICSGVFLPTSVMQLELDPLSAGAWTLEIDEMGTIFPLFIVPAQTVEFTVAAGGAPVPAGGLYFDLLLLASLMLGVYFAERGRRAMA